MKRLRIFFIVLTLLPIIIWLVLGPGLRVWLNNRSHTIISQIEVKTDDHVKIGSISGDLWNGIKVERIIVYADKDPSHLPLFRADQAIVTLSIANIFNPDISPFKIHIKGFNAVLHIAADGTVALPEWTFHASTGNRQVYLAGLAGSSDENQSFLLTCEGGVVEVYKKFPAIPESVDITFTQLEGYGEYTLNEGMRIDMINGQYLATPISVNGYMPIDNSEPMDLCATIGEVNLASLFRDLDPLFRENEYLPEGLAEGEVRVAGESDHLDITGHIELADAGVGNVAIDFAQTSISYSAGIIDLTGMTAQAYGGTLLGSGRVNLLSETPLWSVICQFESIDVPKYLEENDYLRYAMTGDFAGMIEARGDFTDPEALVCSVEMMSQGGQYLTPFSENFMAVVEGEDGHTVIEGDLVDYDDLDLSARIINSGIMVDRFHFVSSDLQVEADGRIGFDKTITADGGVSVPTDRAREHPTMGRFISMLPDSINRVTLEFSISGTLESPQFNPELTDNLLRGLADQGSDIGHDVLDSVTGIGGN